MDPHNVLNKFLNICSQHDDINEYNFASNSVLDWFGRTLLGSKSIHHFYRYDLTQHYEQQFSNARIGAPIEYNTLHMRTKAPPSENLQCPVDKKEQAYETPPQQRKTPILPELMRGQNFSSISDDEMIDDLNQTSISGITEFVTPPKKLSADKSKYEPKLYKDLIEMPLALPKIVKTKRSSSTDISELLVKRSKIPSTSPSEMFINIYSECSTTEPTNTSTNSNLYSELRYIETKGTIRMVRKSKHRGISSTAFDYQQQEIANSDTYLPIDSPKSHLGRGANLKISYRTRYTDGDIQFALIIYESNTKNQVKRNLMNEFDTAKDKIKNAKTKTENKKIKSSNLKRIRC